MNESLMYGSVDQDGKRFPPLSSTIYVCKENDLYLGNGNGIQASRLDEAESSHSDVRIHRQIAYAIWRWEDVNRKYIL